MTVDIPVVQQDKAVEFLHRHALGLPFEGDKPKMHNVLSSLDAGVLKKKSLDVLARLEHSCCNTILGVARLHSDRLEWMFEGEEQKARYHLILAHNVGTAKLSCAGNEKKQDMGCMQYVHAANGMPPMMIDGITLQEGEILPTQYKTVGRLVNAIGVYGSTEGNVHGINRDSLRTALENGIERATAGDMGALFPFDAYISLSKVGVAAVGKRERMLPLLDELFADTDFYSGIKDVYAGAWKIADASRGQRESLLSQYQSTFAGGQYDELSSYLLSAAQETTPAACGSCQMCCLSGKKE